MTEAYLLFKKQGFFLEALNLFEQKMTMPSLPKGKLTKMTEEEGQVTFFFEEGVLTISL